MCLFCTEHKQHVKGIAIIIAISPPVSQKIIHSSPVSIALLCTTMRGSSETRKILDYNFRKYSINSRYRYSYDEIK